MTVRVDEPRRNDETRGVDHVRDAPGVDRREVVDREDPVTQDPDIRATPGRPGAIHDGAAVQKQVEDGHALMMTPRTATSPQATSHALTL